MTIEDLKDGASFLDRCPCPAVGIVGGKGKGTAATLLYRLLSQGYEKGAAYLAGTIGSDPLSFLDKLRPEDVVVLSLDEAELSQLGVAPPMLVVLGMAAATPAYREAAGHLLERQKPDGLAVINDEDRFSAELVSRTKAEVWRYGRHMARRQSAWADASSGQEIAYLQLGETLESVSLQGRKLLGEHALDAILPALLIAARFGVSRQAMQKVVTGFAGLPHRLSYVAAHGGATFYDDSAATVPEAARAALRAFPGQRIHLIAGGLDPAADYDWLATDIVERCASLSLLPGEDSRRLRKVVRRTLGRRPDCDCLILDKAADPLFETILSGIHPHVRQGDVILLSPATPPQPLFAGFKERGDAFAKAVSKRYAAS